MAVCKIPNIYVGTNKNKTVYLQVDRETLLNNFLSLPFSMSLFFSPPLSDSLSLYLSISKLFYIYLSLSSLSFSLFPSPTFSFFSLFPSLTKTVLQYRSTEQQLYLAENFSFLLLLLSLEEKLILFNKVLHLQHN